MPLYEYHCMACHLVTELVRPIGTEEEVCPRCAGRSHRGRLHSISEHIPPLPTDMEGMMRRAVEAFAEREHDYQRVEEHLGHTIARPDDWSGAHAEARERLRRGELDVPRIRREMQRHGYKV